MELKGALTILTCCPLDTWQSTCSSGETCIISPTKVGKALTMSLVLSTSREQIMVVGGTLVEPNQS
jgi:hypothetical protein